MDPPGLNQAETVDTTSEPVPINDKRVIVIAYDASATSQALLHKAIRTRLLEQSDRIHLVHIKPQGVLKNLLTSFTTTATVSPGVTNFNTGCDCAAPTDDDHNAISCAEQDALLDVAQVLKTNGFKNVGVEVLYGDPPNSLKDYCNSMRPTLIMTGTRGLGRVQGSILGSVSTDLAKTCPYPVMIVKLSEEEIAAQQAKRNNPS